METGILKFRESARRCSVKRPTVQEARQNINNIITAKQWKYFIFPLISKKIKRQGTGPVHRCSLSQEKHVHLFPGSFNFLFRQSAFALDHGADFLIVLHIPGFYLENSITVIHEGHINRITLFQISA